MSDTEPTTPPQERQIEIKQQNRRSLMMRIAPSGDLVVLIPHWVKPESQQVQHFIADALTKLGSYLPATKPTANYDSESIRALVQTWASRMGVKPKRVQMRTMYRKWGSCSSRGTITLNTALYYLPEHLVEYVIVHELAHMFVFDHSPAFWAKVGEYLTDYKALESELDQYRV